MSDQKIVVLPKRPKLAPINTSSPLVGYGTAQPRAAAAAAVTTSPATLAAAAALPPSAATAAANAAAEAEATALRDDVLFRESVGASPARVTSSRGVRFINYVERKFSQTAAAAATSRAGEILAQQLAQHQHEQHQQKKKKQRRDGDDDDDDAAASTQSNAGSPDASVFGAAAPPAQVVAGNSFSHSNVRNTSITARNQFRVATVGRKTYIQKMSATATTPPSSSTTPGGGEAVGTPGTPSDAAGTQFGRKGSSLEAAGGGSSSIVEVTHSADEPIDNISFLASHDFFLPRPETVICSAHEGAGGAGGRGDDSNVFEGFDSHGRAIMSSSSGGGGGGDDPSSAAAAADGDDSNKKKDEAPSVTLTEIFSGSKNVPRMFAYNLIDGACFGLWSSSVLPAFMFIIANRDNSFVGFNAALQGGCQMACAVIAAYIGDNRVMRKFLLLRLATLFGLCAIAVTVYAVYSETKAWFWPSSALWGCYIGFANPGSESLFADSVPGGQRVSVYTYKWILQLLSYLFGYITTVIMFEKFGNTWAVGEMRPILYVGLFAHVLSMVSLWSLHDDYTLEVHKVKSTPTATNDVQEAAKKRRSSGLNHHHHHHDHNHHDQNDGCEEADCGHDHERCTLCQQSRKIRVRIVSLAKCKLERCKEKCVCDGGGGSSDNNTRNSGGGSSSGGAGYAAIGSIQNQQQQQQEDETQSASNVSLPRMAPSGNNNNNNNNQRQQGEDADEDEEEDEIVSLADSEDRLMIEELEDDAKREKTGDPLISEMCSCCYGREAAESCCCCCCACCGEGDNSSSSSPIDGAFDETDDDDGGEQPEQQHTSGGGMSPREAEKQQLLPRQSSASSSRRVVNNKSLKDQPLCSKMSLVPLLIVTADIMQAIGGGVTVRFIPLFFMTDLSVSPVELAVVSIILCIFAALLSHTLKKFSSGVSRTHLIVVIRLLGGGLMFLMEFASGSVGGKYPMLTYFVLRSALLNSMMGLSRSIIMDFCRKRHRTFFSAMESVSTLSFSGSAAVGGVVADKYGYRSTFGVTAGFYLVAALIVAPAGVFVDRKKKVQ